MYLEQDFTFKTSQSLFGESHLHHVIDQGEKKEFLDFFTEKTNIKLPNNKKGTIQLQKSNVNLLEKKEFYAMSLPEDGLDFYIFLTRYKKKNMAFLISRFTDVGFELSKIILIDLPLKPLKKDEYYKGTLLEATRVRCDNKKFVFIITDILMLQNKNVEEPFIERMKMVGNFLKDYVEKLEKFPFRIQIVRLYQNLTNLEKDAIKLPYKLDRILFKENKSKREILSYTI